MSHAHVWFTSHVPREEQLKRQPSLPTSVSHVMPTKPGSQWQVLLPVHAPRELQFNGHAAPVASGVSGKSAVLCQRVMYRRRKRQHAHTHVAHVHRVRPNAQRVYLQMHSRPALMNEQSAPSQLTSHMHVLLAHAP